MVFIGAVLGIVALLGFALMIRPCLNMCKRIRLSVAGKANDRKSRVQANGAPRDRDSTEGVRLLELPEKGS
jgi:hypothetical protein